MMTPMDSNPWVSYSVKGIKESEISYKKKRKADATTKTFVE